MGGQCSILDVALVYLSLPPKLNLYNRYFGSLPPLFGEP